MSIEETRAEILRNADANEAYAAFLAPGIADSVHQKAPYDCSDMVLMDRPWLAPQQIGESLNREIHRGIAHAKQLARACEPLDHPPRTHESEVQSQNLGIVDYEMGLSARLENMHQKVQAMLAHFNQADEECGTFVAQLAQAGETTRENNQFFLAKARELRDEAGQL